MTIYQFRLSRFMFSLLFLPSRLSNLLHLPLHAAESARALSSLSNMGATNRFHDLALNLALFICIHYGKDGHHTLLKRQSASIHLRPIPAKKKKKGFTYCVIHKDLAFLFPSRLLHPYRYYRIQDRDTQFFLRVHARLLSLRCRRWLGLLLPGRGCSGLGLRLARPGVGNL